MPTIESSIVEIGVFRFSDTKPEYLLLRRSKTDKIYPDIWQIVSGSTEKDESLLNAALRELKEETGFAPKRFWVVPHMNTFLDYKKDRVHISAVFAAEVPGGADPVLSSEHYQYQWHTFESAGKTLVWPGQVQALEIIHEYIVCGTRAAELSEIPLPP
jgi:dihydroneopterin triphosphate diphosphatase